MSMLTMSQKVAYQHKLDHGWNVTDFSKEFKSVRGELEEAETAYRNGEMKQMVEELADVLIYLLGMTEMAGQDLGEALEKKQGIVGARTYDENNKRTYGAIHMSPCDMLPHDNCTAELIPYDSVREGDTLLYMVTDSNEMKAARITFIDLLPIVPTYCMASLLWLPDSDTKEVYEQYKLQEGIDV